MCTGARYLSGYIRDNESKRGWLKYHTETWERNICTISKIADKYPQEIYAVVVCTIQSEWIFIKLVTSNIGDTFVVVEKMIWKTFLPHLFFKNTKSLSPIIGTLSTIIVSKYGLVLLDPVISANEKYLSLQWASVELIRDVAGWGEFSNSDHLLML